MARSRTIKPSYFKNEDLAECQPLARLLFAGLWTLADKAGRLEDRPKKIKVEILPYDDCSCDDLLNELHKWKFIERYEIEGNRYIQINTFSEHQNPHPKEQDSIIPEPAENCDPVEKNVLPLKETSSNALTSFPSIPSSNLITPTPLPVCVSEKPKEEIKPPEKPKGTFDDFWKVYPKQTGIGGAKQAWQTETMFKGGDPDQIITAAKAYADKHRKTEARFIPKPERFLNDQVYLDAELRAPPRPTEWEWTEVTDKRQQSWPGVQFFEGKHWKKTPKPNTQNGGTG